jgi:hypothetical protein
MPMQKVPTGVVARIVLHLIERGGPSFADAGRTPHRHRA